MDKKLVYIILGVLLLIIVISGATFAYFSSVANGTNNTVITNSKKYEIIYNGGEEISNIKILSSHVGADNTTVQIGLANDVDIPVSATLYLKIAEIGENLATAGFKWEIYSVTNNVESKENEGTLNGATTDAEVPLLTIPSLTVGLQSYKVYFWLDGNTTGNEVTGESFRGHIGARTDNFTGIVDNS